MLVSMAMVTLINASLTQLFEFVGPKYMNERSIIDLGRKHQNKLDF